MAKKCLILIFLMNIFFILPRAISDNLQVNQIISAYIIQFSNLIYPVDSKGQKKPILRVCLLADDSFAEIFTGMASRLKPELTVKKLFEIEQLIVSNCHLVYVQEKHSKHIPDILFNIGLFTISDSALFSERKGIIELRKVQGRIRYIINLKEAEKIGLKVSTELIENALEVL